MSNADEHPVEFTSAHARKLDDIHHALVGNPSMGTEGLATRMKTMEARVESHDRKFWFVTIVGGGLWAVLVAFKEQIFGGK